MSDYLVKQAIRSVWCTPTQDRQSIIALAKISRFGGQYNDLSVMWRTYHLPETGKLYHVYQIGNVSPKHLGLTIPAKAGMWISLSKACIDEKLIVDLYNVNGIQSPRFGAHYTVSDDNDLILAVEANTKVAIDYNGETLFMRVYSNAYYSSTRQDSAVDFIDVQGMVVTTTDEIVTMQNKFDAAKARGFTYAFINGFLVDRIDMISVKTGDHVEFVYDGSIYAVVDLPVSSLQQFDSTLDLKRKYLLHPAGASKTNITYHDDIDVFLTHETSAGRFKGIYYHRNQADAVRQVTHADYSISIPYLNSYANSQADWGNMSTLTVRLQLRKSGYRRPLINEANRIKEMYKLQDADIEPAMASIDAMIPEWSAAVLEASAYTQVMRSMVPEITPALVQRALGYNSMSQYLAPTPQFSKNISGQLLIEIPPNLQFRSTVYEYDFEGVLLGWYPHTLGDVWRCVNPTCHLVEIITGYGTTLLDERYGANAATLDANLDYRMYNCAMFAGVPDNKWVDVTDSSLYVVVGQGLTWLTDQHTTYTLVRSNRDFLAYDLNMPVQRGVLRFTLSSGQNRTGNVVSTLMQLSLGELDVFLNGHPLVEDVDYVVNFPEIVVTNKKFIKAGEQKITVRFCGHCKSDLSRAVLGDRGFVQHGVL